MWEWESNSPRILGFLLCLFLSKKNAAEGVVSFIKRVINRNDDVKVSSCSLKTDSSRVLDTDDCQDDEKRIKLGNILRGQVIGSRLLGVTGDTSKLKDQLNSSLIVSKKMEGSQTRSLFETGNHL